MTTLKNLKGTAIQFLDEDPAVYAGTWSAGGDLNTAKRQGAGFGTQTAGVYAGGNKPPPTTTNVEEYNGTAWSEVNDMPTASFALASATNSPQTSGIVFGGTNAANTGVSAESDSYDGTNWTETAEMTTGRKQLGGTGSSSTAALAFSGNPGPGVLTELWNGSSWTEVNELNAQKQSTSCFGTSTAAIAAGGSPPATTTVEQWNGSSWTEVAEMNTQRSRGAGIGTTTDGLVGGGLTPAPANTAVTEAWNGSVWTEVNDMGTARHELASGGTGSAGWAAGGYTTTEVAATEEWSFPSSPAVQEGDMWFNSSSSTLKGYAVSLPTGTWASGGDLNTARSRFGGAGQATQSAALVFGAGAPPYGQTEEYNGTAWSEQNDMNTGRYISPGGAGTQTAALTAGGYNPAGSPVYNTVNSESYNGTSWTEGNNLNEGRIDCVTFGSSTAAILVGGGEASGGPGTVSSVEIYDGTSWTETTNIPTATQEMAGWGIQTSGAIVGGSVDSDPTMKNTTVEWDGTSWSSGGNYSRNNKYFQAFGSSVTAGLAAGGENPGESPARLSIAAAYNGTSWSEVAELSSARYGTAGGGTTASGLISGGETAPTTVASTEEWTAPAAVVTVTTS